MSAIIEVTEAGISSRENPNIEQHETHIRNFLSMIDSKTGYIED